jgi:hypothetical protein
MARCAVTARVQRAERILMEVRLTAHVAPLNEARTAQRAIPPGKGRVRAWPSGNKLGSFGLCQLQTKNTSPGEQAAVDSRGSQALF